STLGAKYLLGYLGAGIGSDILRDPASAAGAPEYLRATVDPSPISAGLTRLELLGSATAWTVAPGAVLARAPQAAIRIQALAAPVAVARQVGPGLIVAAGDTSAWLDPDISRADNAEFFERLLTF
ncbi:MAG: hypothetical protein FJZ00_09410, partial [Candidatus Sericytochromatia bacterium]|nr:hypothetical protein [Candidatus Tanganyikabacteria bacterium]